jgi:SNF2 family DNA or RNA helicase
MYIPMTGTPITNKPTDVFLPLRLVGGHNFSSYYTWTQYFCVLGGYGGHEVIGYKNIPYLKSLLQGNMLRRLKKDVLDLPPVIQFTDYVENTPYQRKLYASVLQELRESREQIVQSLNPMSAFLKLRQVNGAPELVDATTKVDMSYINKNAKVQMLLDLLADAHEQGHKVIIFSNWVEPLRTLYRIIAKTYKVCCYTGTMSEADRAAHKKAFIENPEYTVILGTIGAMGVSHTLTVAKTVIFYDEPWTHADKQQAWERAHRIGTTSPLNVHTIITRDTVDERVHDIVYTKKDMATYIVDNQLDLRSNPNLFDLLLS